MRIQKVIEVEKSNRESMDERGLRRQKISPQFTAYQLDVSILYSGSLSTKPRLSINSLLIEFIILTTTTNLQVWIVHSKHFPCCFEGLGNMY